MHAHCAGSHGGTHVEVEGSFDNWTTRQALQQSGKDFTIVKLLPSGVYQVLLSLLPATCCSSGSSCLPITLS